MVTLNLTVGTFYDVTSIHRAAERVSLLVVSYAEGCVERHTFLLSVLFSNPRTGVLLGRLLGAFPILVFLRITSPTSFLRGSWHVFLSKAHPFLQVRVGDVEHLHVGVHRFLHHLLERLLLLLGLLLEGLLLLGLLHPLLGELLEGLLLLLGLPGDVGAGGV
jgi:hypothetical protein